MNIAAIIHTLNAEEFLGPCLDSIGDIPVYVFDQGSTDDTEDIARVYDNVNFHPGCVPFAEGEADCRNWALDVVSRPGFFTHFLRIDADEILTDGWLAKVLSMPRDPDCLSVDYWQITDRPIMSQAGNPIEQRGLIYKLAARPRYESRPGKNWHCGIVGPKDTLHVTDPALIHLGYATKNLAAKWMANIDRGDYSDRDDVNAQLRVSMSKNPRAHLHNRGPIPQELLDRSTYLNALAHE
jgi:glycosyltransferase involved in cell wall biosynthesis